MSVRVPLDLRKFSDVFGAMFALGKAIENSGLDHQLLYLVETRVSQINGCGYCIDMHTKDARLEGETEQRLYLLGAWREATIYSARERAALAWAEAVTRLEDGHVSDEVYAQAREHFDEHQLMSLTLAVVGINGWNRFNIAFNNTPGTYKAGSMRKMAGGQA
jgi:AhpD family alkylhydroperoxidase